MLLKNGAPLYFQVANYIREKILSGEWAIGTQIQIGRASCRERVWTWV